MTSVNCITVLMSTRNPFHQSKDTEISRTIKTKFQWVNGNFASVCVCLHFGIAFVEWICLNIFMKD